MEDDSITLNWPVIFGVIGAVVAFCTVPAFAFSAVGWVGVGKALLVGAGCSVATRLGHILTTPLRAGTGFLGYMLGSVARQEEVGTFIGRACTAVPVALFCATQAYSLSTTWLTATTPASAPAPQALQTPTANTPAGSVNVQRPGA